MMKCSKLKLHHKQGPALLILLVLALCIRLCPVSANNFTSENENDVFTSFPPVSIHSVASKRHFYSSDIQLNAPELLEAHGYPVEIHHVYSQSGYILELHRIPAPGKPVIMAYPGQFQSSRDFMMNEDHRNFAHKMADAGFDLWLCNPRGNYYSNKHTYLSTKSLEYWYYSADELSTYDAPAMIDYVLKVTGQPHVNWVGYSLGSAVMFGLLSTQDEYNDKINLFFSLGTTAYVGSTISPVIRFLSKFARLQDFLVTKFYHGEYVPGFLYPVMQRVFPLFCLPEATLDKVGLCSVFLFIIGGINPSQANPKYLPIMLGGTPNSVSVKQLSQWYQWVKHGQLTLYDYGKYENLRRYGTSFPPAYDLHRVRAKTVIIWAENDWLAPPQDVEKTARDLPNVVANVRVSSPSFTHLDFLYGKDADMYAYEHIVRLTNMYS